MRSIAISERNSLAQSNEKLVHKVVHRMSQVCREPYEDLYQLGYIGLIKAADRFDPTTGNAFSSFAIPYIQGEIQHFLRDQWQSVKLPRTAIETKAKVRRLQRSLASLGRVTEALQIALGLGISEEKWREIEALDSNITISLDELLHEPVQAADDDDEIAKRQKATPERIKAYINLGLVKLRISLSQEL
jgi:RNA polymerase sigma-B factor